MRSQPYRRKKPEPTITLINVVFLMLIFFLVAGTIAPRVPDDVALAHVKATDPQRLGDVLVIFASGEIYWQGKPSDPASFVAGLPPEANGVARLMPDRDLGAQRLIEVAGAVRQAGAKEVRLVTERSLP